jgi:DNA-binding NarL/FixJ family response regulator
VTIRVLLVDDDPLVRAGLSLMLDGAEDLAVVGQAADGSEVPDAVAAHAPDVVLMDLRMPGVDGLTAIARLMQRPAPPHVVVLTTFDTDDNVLRALRLGADGFLLKDSPPTDIVQAIRAVAAGEPTLSPEVTRRLIGRVTGQAAAHDRAARALTRLTPREHDVVVSVARGLTNTQIGTALQMTAATVKAHISHILLKLELTNRTQIALLAHDAELL